MIVLYTDFGWNGPYVGQIKAVLAAQAPNVAVIDLMHDLPAFNIKSSAYLLAALMPSFPQGSIFLAVVDPGVGSKRIPCIIKADGYWFVGPDNGLFNIILNRAKSKEMWEIIWQPDKLSNTFHGRDLFASIACDIARGVVNNEKKIKHIAINSNRWPQDLHEVIYIDHYGNCMTGIRAQVISQSTILKFKNFKIKYVRTFSDVKQGDVFWTVNSTNLCEIGVNQGQADQLLDLKIGDKVNY